MKARILQEPENDLRKEKEDAERDKVEQLCW
jgi:hypothetical protein